MNLHFLEKCQPCAGFVPVNLATGANAGARFPMKNFSRVAVVFFKSAGNAAENPTITLTQYDAASAGNSKVLNFERVDTKIGTLTALGTFTKVTQAAANTYLVPTSGDKGAIVVVDIKVDDLDIDNGYAWIGASVGDIGSVSQFGALLYFGHEPRLGAGDVNQHFLEKYQVCSGFSPINMAAGSNPGDVVNLKNYGRCAMVVFAAAGGSGEPPTLSLQQAQEIGGTPKNLTFDRVDVKSGATVATVETFTKIANDDNSYAMAAGDTQKIIVVDVKAEDLDIDNGYNCVVATIADPGNTSQPGCMLYLLHDPRYVTQPLASAIV